jgi:hypothetical protein
MSYTMPQKDMDAISINVRTQSPINKRHLYFTPEKHVFQEKSIHLFSCDKLQIKGRR